MRKRILIIGAGALGKSLAALLADTADVTLHDRGRDVCRQIFKEGFLFKEGGRTRKIKTAVAGSLEELKAERFDVLIMATKVMDLNDAVRASVHLRPRAVLLIQNGLFDEKRTQRSFSHSAVCRGVTTMACLEGASGRSELLYRGRMYLGGKGASLVEPILKGTGLAVRKYRDARQFIYAKLIFNAVMNPLPVITGRGYDMLRQDKRISHLAVKAVNEGRAVARSLGIRLAFDPLVLMRRVKDGDLSSLSYRGSMFADFTSGRPTEVEYMTGALLRMARRKKIDAPALTAILTQAKAAGA